MELPIKTEIIGLDKVDITKIISLYSRTLAYHNFNHIIISIVSAFRFSGIGLLSDDDWAEIAAAAIDFGYDYYFYF